MYDDDRILRVIRLFVRLENDICLHFGVNLFYYLYYCSVNGTKCLYNKYGKWRVKHTYLLMTKNVEREKKLPLEDNEYESPNTVEWLWMPWKMITLNVIRQITLLQTRCRYSNSLELIAKIQNLIVWEDSLAVTLTYFTSPVQQHQTQLWTFEKSVCFLLSLQNSACIWTIMRYDTMNNSFSVHYIASLFRETYRKEFEIQSLQFACMHITNTNTRNFEPIPKYVFVVYFFIGLLYIIEHCSYQAHNSILFYIHLRFNS